LLLGLCAMFAIPFTLSMLFSFVWKKKWLSLILPIVSCILIHLLIYLSLFLSNLQSYEPHMALKKVFMHPLDLYTIPLMGIVAIVTYMSVGAVFIINVYIGSFKKP